MPTGPSFPDMLFPLCPPADTIFSRKNEIVNKIRRSFEEMFVYYYVMTIPGL
jgi:hypothetical protein